MNDKCVWVCDDDILDHHALWLTGCGEEFIIITDTPEENDMKFCCFCGKALKQAAAGYWNGSDSNWEYGR